LEDNDSDDDNHNDGYDCDEPDVSVKREEAEEPELDEDPDEQDFDESFDRTLNVMNGKRSDDKIKREYNDSDDGSEKSPVNDRHKHRYREERSSGDRKHRKHHKSSHKSRESETQNGVKTEFDLLLGLNDQIVKRDHKKGSVAKKTESPEKHHKLSNHSSESKSHSKHIKRERGDGDYSSSQSRPPKELQSQHRLKSLEHSDILSSLPTPNYKPLPNREIIDERVEAATRRKTVKANHDELSYNVQSKKGRTAVFAGQARNRTYTHVHKLEDLCISVLTDNVDKIYYLGDAPYYLLKTVLQKCNTKQLSRIERLNPQIMDETDELWQEFCKKEFSRQRPDSDDDESWRELYLRCGREREDRLKDITKHITHKQAKALPVRQTQFSENVKTPREILRKQERSGISQSFGGHTGGTHSQGFSSNHVRIVPEKPKVAPLMKKALKLQRARYRK